MNEELVWRKYLGIDLDLPFRKDYEETQQSKPNAGYSSKPPALVTNLEKKLRDPLWWEDKGVQQQILQNSKLYPPPPGFSPLF